MGPQGSSCPWLSVCSLESFPGPGSCLLLDPALEGSSREHVRKRREEPNPGTRVEKVRGSADTHKVLVLLLCKQKGRQDLTPAPCLSCLKFLPLGSALPSADSSVLMPAVPFTQHSRPQPLPLTVRRVFIGTFPRKRLLVGLGEVSGCKKERSRETGNFSIFSTLSCLTPFL